MKKIAKILATVAIVFVGLITLLKIIGPSDPIIMTEEEVKADEQKQIELFKNVDLTGFKAKDLNGEEVTSDIFSKSKLTMVNIWSTDCSPCIEEMPDIAKLYNNLPKGSNIISICTDSADDKDCLDSAKKIMKKSDAKFKTLIPDQVLKENLIKDVYVFPTTIFIDSNGKVVGTPHFDEQTEQAYRKSIEDRLKLVEEK